MNVIIDNIIYAIQNAGGISVVFFELTKRLLDDPEINSHYVDYKNSNIFRKQLNIPKKSLVNNISSLPTKLNRYFNINNKLKGIFHSSYYRISNNTSNINVTTVHDFTYEKYRQGLPKIIHTIQKTKSILNSHRIICVSENTKIDLLRFYPTINPQNVVVIYNGVDDAYSILNGSEDSDIKKIIPFEKGEFALFIGDRKSLYKNFNLAIEVCNITNTPLVIIGGGSLTKQEKSFLDDKIGELYYKQLNGISNQILNIIYNNALCLLYPSLYEGFGIPIIEAQRAGCPVISTNFSSIPEVAGKGAILIENVTKFEFADAINLLKINSSMAENLVEEGLINSKRFSWDRCYQQTKDVYKELHEKYFDC